jgi:hypothetical protein
MATSLYDLSVPSYLQSLGAVAGFLDKGSAYCSEKGIDLNAVVETRLFPDMLPFRFQVASVAHHSLGALKGIQAGVFKPPAGLPDLDYAGLQERISAAREELQNVARDEVDALEGRDVTFEIGDRKIPFSAASFVMTFSLPNLYFHATTAYDILRMKGVPVGKRDYMGQLRIKS